MVKKIWEPQHDHTNLCYVAVCYKGTALYKLTVSYVNFMRVLNRKGSNKLAR